jgi:hypothetical protein
MWVILSPEDFIACITTYLHSNNREYFNRDAIEFIEAAPGSRLGQTLVDVTT